MEHDVTDHEFGPAALPDLAPPVARGDAPLLTRLRDGLTVRPALARGLSDGLIILVVCLGGVGGVMGLQRVTASQRPPLAGMAELHSQVLTLPPDPAAAGTPPDASPRTPAPASGEEGTPVTADPPRPLPAVASGGPAGDESGPREITRPAGSTPLEALGATRLARPLTGAARMTVRRLTQAAGFIIPGGVLERATATADVARMLVSVGRPVAARTLVALQQAPEDPELIADLTRQLRAPTARAGRQGPRAAAPETPVTAASREEARSEPAAAEVDLETVPEVEVRSEPGGTSTAPQLLGATLDDPLPVNWLQAMTEQAVTPLTPRN